MLRALQEQGVFLEVFAPTLFECEEIRLGGPNSERDTSFS